MDAQQISVKLTIDALGLPFKVDQFEDRLIFQKAVYLTQAAGVRLGYQFHWYLRGPYCSVLAADGFPIAWELAGETADSVGWKLDDASQAKLAQLRDLFTDDDRSRLARKLELLASVHFLAGRRHMAGQEASVIAQTLQKYGKDFDEHEVAQALEELTRHGLLRPPGQTRR